MSTSGEANNKNITTSQDMVGSSAENSTQQIKRARASTTRQYLAGSDASHERCMSLSTADKAGQRGLIQQVQQEHNLTLAEVRDGCRLAFPARDPTAHGGPQRKATLIHREPNKAAITVQQFTAWVTDKSCAL